MPRVDISNTSYSEAMNRKIAQYKGLVLRAEVTRRDSGKPTKAEARLYAEAAKVCEEIMNLNLHHRSTYEVWKRNCDDCTDLVEDIVNTIAPAPPEPAPPRAAAPRAPEPVRPAAPARPRSPGKAEQTAQDGAAAGEDGDPRPYTETSSGFRTRNASKEVPAETIEGWHKKQPKHGLADLVGMEEQKEMLLRAVDNLGWDLTDDALDISPTQSFFFYGPPGSGKTFLINAFAHDMMEKGYQFLHLEGGDIHQSLVGVAEKIVKAAFQEAIDCAPCVIFIDEVENVCMTRSGNNVQGHEKRLTVAFLEARNAMIASGKRVVFLGATNYPRLVDVAMRDAAHMVRIPLPSEQARADYFRQKLGILPPQEGLDYAYMADQTDNFSYRDLNRLSDAIKQEARETAKRTYTVTDAEGQVDQAGSDQKASDALKSGQIVLTRAWFDESRKDNPPSNKAEIREELLAFEREIEHG